MIYFQGTIEFQNAVLKQLVQQSIVDTLQLALELALEL